ncbi:MULTISPECIES: ribosome maturation factor RimP [Micrococcaceae]|uniref:ribosome maturation factor RimP n=1 Tax=unclassified Kocuria TaxID=2649579 RepID=UPI0013EB08E8|nr:MULTISPECIES: ribosome maturation factor RimP [unclassified Kocuria]
MTITGGLLANNGSNPKSTTSKNTSRQRRRTARMKANAGYSDQAHPRNSLSDTLDLPSLREAIAPVVGQFNLVLEEVSARGAGKNQTVTVVVDLQEDEEGSVSLDTIAEVSGAISETLDRTEGDPEETYLLEVTSPGATRMLSEPRHWKRSRGRLLSLRLSGGETFVARLEETDGRTATIARRRQTPKGVPAKYLEPEEISVEDVEAAQVEIEFSH